MIVFILYLIGYVLSYILGKKCFINTFGFWTVRDRLFHLFIALASWVSALVFVVIYICTNMHKVFKIDFDKEVKW